MGLIVTGIYGMRGQLAGMLGAYKKPPVTSTSFNRNFKGNKVSFPVGYHNRALILPLSVGSIACYIKGRGDLTAVVEGIGIVSASLAGTSSLSANGAMGRNLECNIEGASVLSATIDAKGWLTCTIQIGAQPSAFDIAQAVLNAVATQYNTAGTIGAAIQTGGSAAGGLTTEEHNQLMKTVTVSKFMGLK